MTRSDGKGSVAIVGAGPGGLAAGMLLAASGLKVRIYENAPEIGGRTSRVREGAFSFDRGPTFFMMPYVLEEVFAACGRKLSSYVDLVRLDPMYRLLLGRPGLTPRPLDATQNIPEMARRLGEINAGDGLAFHRFIEHNRYKLRHSESILRNPMRSPLDLFAPGVIIDTLKVAPVLNPHLSVHDLLSRYFKDPMVRLAVSFQSKYLGMSPYDCPSLFTILPFIEYEYGIWHPIGGCNALMHAMARVAEELGAEIMTNTPVAGLEFAGTACRGVRVGGAGPLAGTVQNHEHVVLNADATWAMKHLIPPDLRTQVGRGYSDGVIDRKKYSCSTYMLYLGVDGEVDLPHHTIYISEQYRQNLEDITTNGTLTPDASVYVCNPSRIDSTLAPKGQSSLYVLAPVPNSKASIDWATAAPMMRERVLDQTESKLGVSLRSRILSQTQITPANWQAANINFGATFNLSHNLGQMLHKRPQNKLAGFDNVYLVGGGTHPGSGLPTIFLSAQISSNMLCKQAGVAYAGHRPEVRAISQTRAMLT